MITMAWASGYSSVMLRSICEVMPAGVIVEQLVAEARAAISRIAALNR